MFQWLFSPFSPLPLAFFLKKAGKREGERKQFVMVYCHWYYFLLNVKKCLNVFSITKKPETSRNQDFPQLYFREVIVPLYWALVRRLLLFWAPHGKRDWGAGACPGMRTKLGKGLQHQEQQRELGGLSLNKRRLRGDLLAVHHSTVTPLLLRLWEREPVTTTSPWT